METPLIIIARTDGLSAKLIDSNIDSVDHPWILGIYDINKP
jgi:isocitrate lyase